MEGQAVLLICILLPLIGAFLLPVMGRSNPSLRNVAALLLALIPFALSVFGIPGVMNGEPMHFMVEMPLGLSFGLYADSLAVFAALIVSLATALVIFYSFGYVEDDDHQSEYYMMIVLFLAAMLLLVYTTNLIFIYMAWEIAAVCAWRLIGFYRRPDDIRSASKSMLLTAAGSLTMLIGFIAIYMQSGSFDLLSLQGKGLDNGIMLLILFGLLSKSAVIPLHSWLVDTDKAPASVCALLGAVLMVNFGIYAYIRLFLVTFQLEPVWETALPTICVISALISAGAALREYDLKRLLLYASINQVSYILLGLSSNTMIGTTGALLYMLMHALAQCGLYLCAGVIEHTTGTGDLQQLSGLRRHLPVTMVACLLCLLSLMGLPPFGGFFAKYMIASGVVQGSKVWIAACYIIGSVLTMIFLLRMFVRLFLGSPSHQDIREGSWEMVTSAAVMGLLSLLFGIVVSVPVDMITMIIDTIGRW